MTLDNGLGVDDGLDDDRELTIRFRSFSFSTFRSKYIMNRDKGREKEGETRCRCELI